MTDEELAQIEERFLDAAVAVAFLSGEYPSTTERLVIDIAALIAEVKRLREESERLETRISDLEDHLTYIREML